MVSACLLAGCGSSKEAQKENKQINDLIESLQDSASAGRLSLAKCFVKSAAPSAEQTRRMAKYTYQPAGSPSIDGDTATVQVKILDARDQEIAQKEWTCVREGEIWKLKSAPVP
jgi:hypothetical protein